MPRHAGKFCDNILRQHFATLTLAYGHYYFTYYLISNLASCHDTFNGARFKHPSSHIRVALPIARSSVPCPSSTEANDSDSSASYDLRLSSSSPTPSIGESRHSRQQSLCLKRK